MSTFLLLAFLNCPGSTVMALPVPAATQVWVIQQDTKKKKKKKSAKEKWKDFGGDAVEWDPILGDHSQPKKEPAAKSKDRDGEANARQADRIEQDPLEEAVSTKPAASKSGSPFKRDAEPDDAIERDPLLGAKGKTKKKKGSQKDN